MKIKVMFKTPDVLEYALDDLSDDDTYDVKQQLKKFIQYGECVTIEFDTEAGTATVVPI